MNQKVSEAKFCSTSYTNIFLVLMVCASKLNNNLNAPVHIRDVDNLLKSGNSLAQLVIGEMCRLQSYTWKRNLNVQGFGNHLEVLLAQIGSIRSRVEPLLCEWSLAFYNENSFLKSGCYNSKFNGSLLVPLFLSSRKPKSVQKWSLKVTLEQISYILFWKFENI